MNWARQMEWHLKHAIWYEEAAGRELEGSNNRRYFLMRSEQALQQAELMQRHMEVAKK